MKTNKIVTLSLCGLLALGSCSTKTGTGSLIGTGAGAVLGGIIGNIIGKDTKATAIGAAIGGAVGAGTGALIGKKMDKVAAQAAAVENAKVEEVTDANGLKAVKVTFDSGILFATGKSTLNSASKNSLAKFSEVLKSNSDCYVDIYGHTDRSGGDGVNIPLSQKRAESVQSYLRQCGVSSSQMQNVVGKGSSEEIEDAVKSQTNRRVEVYLYASQAMIDAANNGTLQ